MLLYLIRQPLARRAAAAPAGSAPVVHEWVDPRYVDLAAAWKAAQPPPEVAGFLHPLP
jgi:hypothetical protein